MKTSLAILATIGIILSTCHQTTATEPSSLDALDSKEERAMKDVETIQTQMRTFEMICGRLPTEDEGIKALVENPDPENLSRWRQLLEFVPRDPWGREYGYRLEEKAKYGFVVFSFGSDPQNADDIITTK